MSIILNETRQAEAMIEKGEVGKKPASTLFLLGKYYRQKENLDKKQTAGKLHAFMEANYKNYNPALWEETIEHIAKKAKEYPLREVDSIGITQAELNTISGLHHMKYERLLFTMLCHAKFYNTVSEKNNSWVNTDIQELYRAARVTVKYRRDKFLYLNDLEQKGLLSFSNRNDNLNIKLNFCDMEGEAVLEITDFREPGYEYLKYLGDGRFINCKCCNRLVKKTNNKCLYCGDCARLVQHRQKYEWDARNKKSEK